MSRRTYLDWNATAPLRPEARAAMISALDVVGNPSSVHAEGRAALGIIQRAREDVAAAVGCKPSEVVFTSGATEAAAILSRLPRSSAVCVQDTAHDALWTHFDLTGVESGMDGPGHVYAMGLANSETGVITEPPNREDGAYRYGQIACHAFLLDITQAVGRIPFAYSWSGADLAILSAHKLGGPKGVGALIVREGTDITPVLQGGGQELGRRSGTENVAGIAGFGAACRAAMADLEAGKWRDVEKLRNILETTLADGAKDTIFIGKELKRLPNTSCFATPGWRSETQVMQMDLAGFAISAGSACSSGKVKSSRVLAAMGFEDDVAQSAVRVSLGPQTTEDDVSRFTEAWLAQHEKFRRKAA